MNMRKTDEETPLEGRSFCKPIKRAVCVQPPMLANKAKEGTKQIRQMNKKWTNKAALLSSSPSHLQAELRRKRHAVRQTGVVAYRPLLHIFKSFQVDGQKGRETLKS